jgi:hypothetical protein
MISTELDSRRVAAPDERATLFPTGGACSSLATAVRLQRLDGLLERDCAGPTSALVTTRSTVLTETLPPFDERSERRVCQADDACSDSCETMETMRRSEADRDRRSASAPSATTGSLLVRRCSGSGVTSKAKGWLSVDSE